MRNEILTMLEMQQAMNAKVNNDWLNQGFAWYRAIWVECAELMDHYGWKWWKKQSPDIEQVNLELVDIWHFGLSQLLQSSADANAGSILLEPIIEEAIDGFNQAEDGHEFRSALETFTLFTLSERKFSAPLFANLMKSTGLSFDELYRQYLGKNVLNFFRQDNGYQDGSYKKVWNGREDNEHLVEVVAALDIRAADAKDILYKELAQRYAEV